MTSTYEEILTRVLRLIKDYDFLRYTEEDVHNMITDYMLLAISEPYVQRIFSSVAIDAEHEVITYELSRATTDAMDKLFIEDILSRAVVVGWLEPQVKSTANITQMFGGKEQKFYAQANHLSELRALLDDSKIELRKRIRDRGYIHNSYVEV